MSQPQVSKHLRVLSEVGLVRCRADGRHRLYRLEPGRLAPFHEWLGKYERGVKDRMDRMDDYLKSYNDKESGSDTSPARIGSHRLSECSRDRHHSRVRRSD